MCITCSNIPRNDHFTPKGPSLTSLSCVDWHNFLPVNFCMEKCLWERTDSVFSSRRVWLSDDLEYKSCLAKCLSWWIQKSIFIFIYLFIYYTARRLATVGPPWASKLSSRSFLGILVKLLWGLGKLQRGNAFPPPTTRSCTLCNGISLLREYENSRLQGEFWCAPGSLSHPLRFKIGLLSWPCWSDSRIDGCC